MLIKYLNLDNTSFDMCLFSLKNRVLIFDKSRFEDLVLKWLGGGQFDPLPSAALPKMCLLESG